MGGMSLRYLTADRCKQRLDEAMSNWSYVGPLWQVPKDSVGSGRDFECPGKIAMRS